MIIFQPSLKEINKNSAIFITSTQIKTKKISIVDADLSTEIFRVVESGKFLGQYGDLFPLIYKKKLVVLAGLGLENDLTPTGLRVAVRNVFLSPYLKEVRELIVFPHSQSDEAVEGFIEGICIGTYSFDKHITKKKKDLVKKFFVISPEKKKYIEMVAICDGINFTRELVNDNAETVNSDYIENILRVLIKGRKNVSFEVLGKKELKKKGLNLILAVNSGSSHPPKLMIVDYRAGSKNQKHIAVCGKGITFDTGGLNLKPTGYMETMRLDMAGAAAVLGALKNTIALGIKKNILFVFGVAENAIGSKAQKPGDVVRSYSGKTVEIANTDAEGRLVLADAISYVVKKYKPGCVIDIATLTGACVIALGYDYSAVLSNNDDVAGRILTAAKKTDDRAWQLPLYPEIKDHLKSQYADIKNTGLPKGAAGTISAAEFIRQFVGDVPWAHIDIASTAFVDGQSRLYFGNGATGSGVRMLTYFLKN